MVCGWSQDKTLPEYRRQRCCIYCDLYRECIRQESRQQRTLLIVTCRVTCIGHNRRTEWLCSFFDGLELIYGRWCITHSESSCTWGSHSSFPILDCHVLERHNRKVVLLLVLRYASNGAPADHNTTSQFVSKLADNLNVKIIFKLGTVRNHEAVMPQRLPCLHQKDRHMITRASARCVFCCTASLSKLTWAHQEDDRG